MKRLFNVLIAVLLTACVFGQTPQKMSFQLVVRNSSGALVQNSNVGIRITILRDSTNGSVVYKEIYNPNPQTNANGLLTIEIGSGIPITGTFSSINWANTIYFIKSETDPNGGTNYSISGVSQLLSVPYALHSKTTEIYTETDPIFLSHVASGITSTNISNWNSAYGWGNHATAGYLTSFTETDPIWTNDSSNYYTKTKMQTSGSSQLHFNNITNKPTILAGYGITDAMSNSHVANGITSTNISNWNTAYSWGNHATAGYLTSFTETDPVWTNDSSNYYTKTKMQTSGSSQLHFNNIINKPTTLAGYGITDAMSISHVANGITSTNISNWNTAFGWGNHATAGYLTSFTETDPIWTTASANYYTITNMQTSGASQLHFNNITNKPTTLSGYGITDAMNTSHIANGITSTNIADWNTAFGWGNHANAGYAIFPSQTGNNGKYLTTNGTITSWSALAIVATSGNYNDLTNKPTGTNTGDMQFWNGTQWVLVPIGSPGQFLQISPSNIPTWSGSAFATLTTGTISTITQTTALCGGNITNDGGSSIVARGICYSISNNPTIANNHTTDSTGIGSYTSILTGLTANTIYYLRAYATNSAGTSYGNLLTFTTLLPILPTLTTTAISSIISTSSASGGNITNDGGAFITARGVCWSIVSNPTISNSHTSDGNGIGSFTSNLIGLSPTTTYYVRAYASNISGTAYGNQQSFTTLALAIGQSYQGGIIAYILQSSDPGYIAGQTHGLIAAPSDQSAGIQWYNGSYTTTGATATTLGTGNANTNTIVTIQGAGSYAAKFCYDLVLGGYSDWYLPSKDELNKLFLNQVAIGGFANNCYWSSSESNSNFAWLQNFNTGNQFSNDKGSYTTAVRAIRSF